MHQTEKQKTGNLVSWIEYEPATKEPSGNWKASGIGRIRFKHDDGHAFMAETDSKVAYGRTALKKIGVIKSAGGRDFPATKGPKFDEVYALVMELDGSDRWVGLAKDAKIEE